jgi:Icc-related predicted phosphoesterase
MQEKWWTNMFEQGKLAEMENSDIICFCGDMSGRGYNFEIEAFLKWFNELVPTAKKIYIAGNHDYFFDYEYLSRGKEEEIKHFEIPDPKNTVKEMLEKYPEIEYLHDSGFEWMGLKFWGSPIQPWFNDWAFNRLRGEKIKKHWDLIPEDTDVLLVHGPPYMLGDELAPRFRRYNEDKNVGCKDLLERVKIVKPKVCAYGHIHEGYGEYKHDDLDTRFINASCLDDTYSPVNKPVTIDIEI